MLYVDKSVEIELREGAVLKLAPEVCRVEPEGEITTDQDAGKKLDDLEIGGVFDTSRPAVDGRSRMGQRFTRSRLTAADWTGSPIRLRGVTARSSTRRTSKSQSRATGRRLVMA